MAYTPITRDTKKGILDKAGTKFLEDVEITSKSMTVLVEHKVMTKTEKEDILALLQPTRQRDALKDSLYTGSLRKFISFCVVFHDHLDGEDVIKDVLKLNIEHLRTQKEQLESARSATGHSNPPPLQGLSQNGGASVNAPPADSSPCTTTSDHQELESPAKRRKWSPDQPGHARAQDGNVEMTPDETEKTTHELNPELMWIYHEFHRLRESLEGRQLKPVVIALLDSGVMTMHPDLQDLVIEKRNFVGSVANGEFLPDATEENDLELDVLNHGTLSAGIIRQCSGTISKILNLKVMNRNGVGGMEAIARALKHIHQWDTGHPELQVDIVLMTFGSCQRSNEVDKLLSDIGESKILICAAANEGQTRANSVLYPATHGNVIAIGACTKSGNRWRGSAVGPTLAYLYLGADVQSTSSTYDVRSRDTRYITKSGTSFAAPYCAAFAALLLGFVEAQITNCKEKDGRHWRKVFTKTSKMNDFMQEFCDEQHSSERGHGTPDFTKVTKKRIEDYIERNAKNWKE